MDQFLKSLRSRKAYVQKCIDEEQSRPSPDGLRLIMLKKFNLRFREQIDFIERHGRESMPVRIPVVRRKPFNLQGT
jgi:hypothetical protein